MTDFYDATPVDERRALQALARRHPVFKRCQQDPYTHRALLKPRGHAGDAVMLD